MKYNRNNQLVVSVYGNPDALTSTLLGNWWKETDTWARNLKLRLNEVSARFREKPNGMTKHRAHSIARYGSRVAAEIEAGNVDSLDLIGLWAEGGYKTSDWEFYGIYGKDPSSRAVLSVGVDIERMRDLSGTSSFEFTDEAVRRSRVYLAGHYGFAITMPAHYLPVGYAIGVASGNMPDEMIYETNAWSQFSGKECDRTLRNVFGYNILNSRHLDIDVGNMRLEDWVKAGDGQRGRIEPMVFGTSESLPASASRKLEGVSAGVSAADSSAEGGLTVGKAQEQGLFLWTFQEGGDQEKFLWWDYPSVVAVREELKKFKIFPWQRLAGIE